MTYREAVARVTGLRGGEMAGMRPGLERIETLLESAGHPERAMTLVQVAGTNGKGSICAMLAASVQAAGRRVGLYTSPHLLDIRERIRVDGRPISEADFADGVEALGTLVARLDATMFEALTALALDHFARESVEVAVLEVGMGGRLDSTTVGRPAVEVVSRIDLDHQAYLGDTIEKIASEKAAIIRSGIAVSARQEPGAESVIVRRAAEAGVPLLLEGRDLHARVRRSGLDGLWLDLDGPGFTLDQVRVALLGVFQPGNALLAATAALAPRPTRAVIVSSRSRRRQGRKGHHLTISKGPALSSLFTRLLIAQPLTRILELASFSKNAWVGSCSRTPEGLVWRGVGVLPAPIVGRHSLSMTGELCPSCERSTGRSGILPAL